MEYYTIMTQRKGRWGGYSTPTFYDSKLSADRNRVEELAKNIMEADPDLYAFIQVLRVEQ